MSESKKDEYIKKYTNLACDNLSQEAFLDAWWSYLADNGIWYSAATKEKLILSSLDSSHLYNIRNIILTVNEDKLRLPSGAAKLISIIDFLMMKKSKEVGDDLPF